MISATTFLMAADTGEVPAAAVKFDRYNIFLAMVMCTSCFGISKCTAHLMTVNKLCRIHDFHLDDFILPYEAF